MGKVKGVKTVIVIRRDEACLDYGGQGVIIYPCHGEQVKLSTYPPPWLRQFRSNTWFNVGYSWAALYNRDGEIFFLRGHCIRYLVWQSLKRALIYSVMQSFIIEQFSSKKCLTNNLSSNFISSISLCNHNWTVFEEMTSWIALTWNTGTKTLF